MIGVDGKIVIVKHGLNCIRVHINRCLLKTNSGNIKTTQEENTKGGVNTQTEHTKRCVNTEAELAGKFYEIEEQQDSVEEQQEDKEDSVEEQQGKAGSVVEREKSRFQLPSTGSEIKYIPVGSKEWTKAKIISRGGKVGGKYQNWLNIEDEEGITKAIDWKNGVSEWVTDSEESDELFVCVARLDTKQIKDAKQRELDTWKEFKVTTEVPDRGQHALSLRWVCTEKISDGIYKPKARLVARGFEENLSDSDIRVDSPTASKPIIKIFFGIIATHSWQSRSIDIKAAFLQGTSFEREVFLKPPKEAGNTEGKLWKLNKAVYGLNDASRVWYFTVRNFLLNLGCTQVRSEPAMFYWYKGNKFCGIFVMHVDDFLWGGSIEFESSVIEEIKKEFKIGSQEAGAFKYVGLDIQQTNDGIVLGQSSYLETVENIPIERGKYEDSDTVNKNDSDNLRTLVGQLNWLGSQTRPDCSFDVLELSTSLKHPLREDMLRANKTLKKLKLEESSILFPDLGDPKLMKLVVFSDASHANLPDGYSSAGGYIIFLVGNNKRSCPLAWEAKKIRRVVKSTLAAETLALVEAVDMAYYLGRILTEILYRNKSSCNIPIECFIDNKSLWENAHSTKGVSERRLRIDIAAIKEMLERKEISAIKWVETSHQLSDCFTKKGVHVRKLLEILKSGNLYS